MNETVKQEILNTIKAYPRIVLCRHVRPDGDAVGSTLGLAFLLPEAVLYGQTVEAQGIAILEKGQSAASAVAYCIACGGLAVL